MSKATRIALVGCGQYAVNHLHAWSKLSAVGAQLVAVCDAVSERANAMSRQFGVPAFSSMGALCDAVEVDLIDIVAGVSSNPGLVAFAASRRIGVIVQKPVAVDWETALRIKQDVLAADIWFAVHENFRFRRPMRRIRQILDDGAIGQPRWGRLSWRSGFDVLAKQPYLAEMSRFALMDVGVHLIDLARFLFGEGDRVYCELQSRTSRMRGEDSATVMLHHSNGAVSVVDCTYSARREPDLFPQVLAEIEGENGSILLQAGLSLQVTVGNATWTEHLADGGQVDPLSPAAIASDAVFAAQAHMLQRFQECRRADTDLLDNLKSFALVEAAYASAVKRVPVQPMDP